MAKRASEHEVLAVCAPGLERMLQDELRGLGFFTGRRIRGGVEARATTRAIYDANVWSRLASRITVRVDSFPAQNFDQLTRWADGFDWSPWVGDDTHIDFRVSSAQSQLFHTGAIAERLVEHSPGVAADLASMTQTVIVRAYKDRFTVSMDTSGEGLHRRGWRGPVAKAPIRPTLAAALLTAAGFDGSGPVVDPFCGSGTIVIEAARWARGLPPGSRRYRFQDWPTFEGGTWASVNASIAAATAEPRAISFAMVGRDRDAGAVAAASANADAAEVADVIDVAEAAVSDLTAPAGASGWLVTNPPYGKRVGGDDLRNLYARLGAVAQAEFAGWTAAMVVDDTRLASHAGLTLGEAFATMSGGLQVTGLTGSI